VKSYEGLFILYPAPEESVLDDKLEIIRAEIVKLGGTVAGMTRMGKNAFSRPLKRKESGYYVLIRFTFDPAKLVALNHRFKLHEDILRAQITLAVKAVPKKEVVEPVAVSA